ncbi:hypothetical protein [uncultured Mediterranea sp.]|uniref:hypothetical protein n=1 Tax=uncultured Mediterranea sp. TaxID=1926662 RepID=UPI0028041270|nr:hypothetical protein [uncultured Mediterranea sp.]
MKTAFSEEAWASVSETVENIASSDAKHCFLCRKTLLSLLQNIRSFSVRKCLFPFDMWSVGGGLWRWLDKTKKTGFGWSLSFHLHN